MLRRVILAIVVGIVAALVTALIGLVLEATHLDILVSVGVFLKAMSVLFGILAGVWYFLTGQSVAI